VGGGGEEKRRKGGGAYLTLETVVPTCHGAKIGGRVQLLEDKTPGRPETARRRGGSY
jgi:hypothetical protein